MKMSSPLLFTAALLMISTSILYGDIVLMPTNSGLTSLSPIYETDFHTSSDGYSYSYTNANALALYANSPSSWAIELASKSGGATFSPGLDNWFSNQNPYTYGSAQVNFFVNPMTPSYVATFGGDFVNGADGSDGGTYTNPTTGYPAPFSYTIPTQPTTYLEHAANTGNNSIFFASTFALTTGSQDAPANVNVTTPVVDTLGWTILNSANNPLMSINFIPTEADGGYNYKFGVTTYGSNAVTNYAPTKANGTPLNPLTDGGINQLAFEVVGIGTTNQTLMIYTTTNSLSVKSRFTNYSYLELVSSNKISGYSDIAGSNQVGYLGASWYLSNTNDSFVTNINGQNMTLYPNYGAGGMNIYNVVTAAIPEPNAWILFGISGLIMVIALRRKA